MEDPEECAQFMGTVAKWPGFGEFRELEHRGNIRDCQRAKFGIRSERGRVNVDRDRADHLVEGATANQRPSGRR